MQLINLLATFLILLFTSMAFSQYENWANSCDGATLDGSVLTAYCNNNQGDFPETLLDLMSCLGNNESQLEVCNPSYSQRSRAAWADVMSLVPGVVSLVPPPSLCNVRVSKFEHKLIYSDSGNYYESCNTCTPLGNSGIQCNCEVGFTGWEVSSVDTSTSP